MGGGNYKNSHDFILRWKKIVFLSKSAKMSSGSFQWQKPAKNAIIPTIAQEKFRDCLSRRQSWLLSTLGNFERDSVDGYWFEKRMIHNRLRIRSR